MRTFPLVIVVACLFSPADAAGHEVKRVRKLVNSMNDSNGKFVVNESIPSDRNPIDIKKNRLLDDSFFTSLFTERKDFREMSMSFTIYPTDSPSRVPKPSTTPKSDYPSHFSTSAPTTSDDEGGMESPTTLIPISPSPTVISPATTAPSAAPNDEDQQPTTMAPSVSGTGSPSINEETLAPSLSPTSSVIQVTKAPTLQTTESPTSAEGSSEAPTPIPSTSTSLPTTSQPSQTKTGIDTTTVVPRGDVVFTCNQLGDIDLAREPYTAVTEIPFEITYALTSTVSFFEYGVALELKILATAVAGALQCNEDSPLFIAEDSSNLVALVNMLTIQTEDSCDPAVATCSVLQTSFRVFVENDSDPDVAAFLGYLLLREQMDENIFLDFTLQDIDRIEYLSPVPLLPPMVSENGETNTNPQLESVDLVNGWAVGCVVAASVAGLIALGAWARNRRIRNQRHLHLIEEMSMASPSMSVEA